MTWASASWSSASSRPDSSCERRGAAAIGRGGIALLARRASGRGVLAGAAAAVVMPRGRGRRRAGGRRRGGRCRRRRARARRLDALDRPRAGRDHRRRRGSRGRVDGERQRLSGDQDDRDLALVGRGGRNRSDPHRAQRTATHKGQNLQLSPNGHQKFRSSPAGLATTPCCDAEWARYCPSSAFATGN